MRLRILTIIILIFAQLALAAFEKMIPGASCAGVGGASAAVQGRADGLFVNPAGISCLDHLQISSSYSRPFGIEALHLASAAAGMQTRVGGVGIGMVSFGESLYRETTLHFCWAGRMMESVSIGVQARLAQLRIQNYGSANVWMLDFGMIYALTPHFNFGMSADNVNQARLGILDDPLPQVTQWGFSCRPHASVMFCLDLVKDVRFPLEIRGGAEYRPVPGLALRSGFGQDPTVISMGIGIRIFHADLDYAYTQHPALGGTHQTSIIYLIR